MLQKPVPCNLTLNSEIYILNFLLKYVMAVSSCGSKNLQAYTLTSACLKSYILYQKCQLFLLGGGCIL